MTVLSPVNGPATSGPPAVPPDLVWRLSVVHSEPSGPAEPPDYRQSRVYGPGEEVPVVIEGAQIARLAVQELLP